MIAPRTRRLGLPAVIIVAVFSLFAVPASAHTELEKSTPDKGATVRQPAEVTLVFSDNVRLAKIKVVAADGAEFQSGTPTVAGDTVVQAVSDGLAAGPYTLAYRVVSADGHPVEGEVPFKITAANGAAPAASDTAASDTAASDTAASDTAASDTAASASAPPDAAAPAGDGRPAADATTTNGGQKWVMVGAGLMAGMGIGIAIVFLRRGKDGRPAGD